MRLQQSDRGLELHAVTLPALIRQTKIEWAGVDVGAKMFVVLTNVIARASLVRFGWY